MAIILLHGEQTIKSREKLSELITESKKQGEEIKIYQGKDIKPHAIEEITAETNLFGESRTIIIEEFFTQNRASKKRDQLLAILFESELNLIFWEKKLLTAATIKKLPQNTQVLVFKPQNLIWSFLDELTPKMSPNQISTYAELFIEDFYLLAMLERQIRLLIQIKSHNLPKLAPFQIQKLKQQAQKWTWGELFDFHQKLLELEIRHKSTKTALNLSQDLILLCYNL